ncbi:MAG: CocE/NonD family hydrolase [Thermoplasmata archaeon]|nr:CocE/NonD family hydrolase [Thermoplasmata archaeon]
MKKQLFLPVLVVLLMISIAFSGCVSKTTYMVEMRDGIHLATDVYLPSKKSPHGVILIRTPYNKNNLQRIGTTWALLGWPVVIQDMRGRFASEGIDMAFRKAHVDGVDTLLWIAQQPWCNGHVATFGASALGICQYFLAGVNPPYLACQYAGVANPNLHHYAIFQGGEFRKSLMEGWLQRQNSTFILPEWFAHENYTLDYWSNVSLDGKWHNVNVPAIHLGGWYDIFCQGTIDAFIGYQYYGGEGARGKSKLIMGPWTHDGINNLKQGQLQYPENSKCNFSNEMFTDMLDEYTMNGGNDFDKWPAVAYYVMGDVTDENAPGNAWLIADDWPPLPYTTTSFYFHKDGSLSTEMTSSDSITFTYNPKRPAPTLGGQNLYIAKGPYDQRLIENRDDVIVFTSDSLNEPVWVTGRIKARLYVSSDCPDTDFTVKICDVYPDGRSMLITDGILRMRNRNGFDHWEFMEAGKVYEIEVDLWSTAYIWNKGHKIRVEVSSSNAPRFLANPNTRAPIASDGETKIAHNTLYFGNAYPSCILLPVVTGAEFKHEASKASVCLNYLIKKSRAKLLSKLSILPDKIVEDFMEELSKNYYDDL